MVGRPEKLTHKDLTVAELIALIHASGQNGIYGSSLARITGENVSTGATHRRLGALSNRGLLEYATEHADLADTHQGPARKIYKSTPEGLDIARQALWTLGENVLDALSIKLNVSFEITEPDLLQDDVGGTDEGLQPLN